jgi:hypothetical protein
MKPHSSWKAIVPLYVLLLILDVSMRMTGHPPNFTPLAATALFASFLFGAVIAATLPVAAMAIGDYVTGTYDWHLMVVVYAALCLPVFFGPYVRAHRSAIRIGVSTLAASVLFFVTTNYAVWLFGSWYTPDVRGLLECYASALAFFRNTVMGDLFWSAILFGGYAVVKQAYASLSPRLSLGNVL